MCGRYSFTLPIDAMIGLFRLAPESRPNLAPRYNIAPTQDAPVIRSGADGGRALDMLRWGLVPNWAEELSIGAKMINARAETAHEKPSFRAAYAMRRCLVPADGFYEWKRPADGAPKQPYRIARADGEAMVFAGLWERWEQGPEPVESFTILTTEASADIAAIHHRMPVILEPDAFETWLNGPKASLAALLGPSAATLIATPISTKVNAVRNDGPELWEPVEPSAAEAPPKPKAQQFDLF